MIVGFGGHAASLFSSPTLITTTPPLYGLGIAGFAFDDDFFLVEEEPFCLDLVTRDDDAPPVGDACFMNAQSSNLRLIFNNFNCL
jgi:hypothetical protein